MPTIVRPLPTQATAYLRLFTFLLIVTLSIILTLPMSLPGRVQLAEGQPAPTDIFAPQDKQYESAVLTAQDRAKAAQAAGPVYDYNSSLVESGRRRLTDLLNLVETVRGATAPPDAGSVTRLRQALAGTLTDAESQALLNSSDSNWSRLRYDALRVYDNIMISGKIADLAALERTRSDLPGLFSKELSAAERQAAAALVQPLLAINLIENPAKTEAAGQAAAAELQPRIVALQKGEIILRVGQIADPLAIEKLENAGLSNPTVTPATAVAGVGLVIILCLLLHFYLLRLQPRLPTQRRQLALLGLVIVAPTLVMRIIVPGHAVWPYALPVAACSMLVAVLLDAHLAILITVILGCMAGVLTHGSMALPFYYFAGGLAAILAIWRSERITTFVLSGVYVAGVSLAATLLMRLLDPVPPDMNAVLVMIAAAAINGALTASLTFATFSLLGSVFGITTGLQLLELAQPTQPLLRRLMREAPGTYHHSLLVSNLAEHAAEIVGADPLLARVAAYYHDIGKVNNPHAFIENQSGMPNIHDALDPLTSTRLVRAHVTDGVELARKARLPRRVVDFIPQHHGTTLIKYFYHKALKDDPNTNIEDFRYSGPKPQSKEAAILMLADSVEATVRAIAGGGHLDPNSEMPNSIPGIVHRTMQDRLEDGQLDECDLTVRDLARIQDAFCNMLNGMYHPRINYPEGPTLPAPPARREVGLLAGPGANPPTIEEQIEAAQKLHQAEEMGHVHADRRTER